MYESSSESSIERGNFPSVINLYDIDKKIYNAMSEPIQNSQSSNPPSLLIGSNQIQDSERIPSYKESYNILKPEKNYTSHNTNFQHILPQKINVTSFILSCDQDTNYYSPKSTSDEADSDDYICQENKKLSRSIISPSTSNSSGDDFRWNETSRKERVDSGSPVLSYLPPPMLSLASHQIVTTPLVHRPSFRPSVKDSINIVGSPCSSSTLSSGNSSATTQVHHSKFTPHGKIQTVLALHNQLAADSGISNTSPETQSSTEFQLRSLDGDGSGSLALGASAGDCLVMCHSPTVTASSAIPAAQIMAGQVQMSSCLTGMTPQGILKIRGHNSNNIDMKMQEDFKANLFNLLSVVYAILLVILGCVLPMMEIISEPIALHMFETFYLYLLLVAIFFLLYVYIYLMRRESSRLGRFFQAKKQSHIFSLHGGTATPKPAMFKRKVMMDHGELSASSFYLRLGSVGFGLTSMIRDGLEAARLFELSGHDRKCTFFVLNARPLFSLIFSFLQLHFIFINSKICIHKFKVLARFGLMHLVATNICVWLRIVIKETLLEVSTKTANYSSVITVSSTVSSMSSTLTAVTHVFNASICSNEYLLSGIVSTATPYLYPCAIQYNGVAAGLVLTIWFNIGKMNEVETRNIMNFNASNRSPMKVSVDCSGSNRGLFLGLLVFVFGLVCLIIFYVLRTRPLYLLIALRVIYAGEVGLLLVSLIAVFIAFFKMQDMQFCIEKNNTLDEVFHFVSLIGVLIYAMFEVLAGHVYYHEPIASLLIVSGLLATLQAITQSVFVATALRRMSYKAIHERDKPGREFLSFLLICNLTMWALYTLETRQSEPAALLQRLCGKTAWSLLARFCVPLLIFYRFHSTVCLSVVWRNAYKIKEY